LIGQFGGPKESMMRLIKRFLGMFFLAALALAGCHELGHIDGIGDYGGMGGNDVVGEVAYVDARAREIEIRTDAGRTSVLRYDDKTQVIYQQRNYAVANLERGDYIAARVQQDRDGRSYTDTITVRESVQDRGSKGGGAGHLERAEGRVEYIDPRRGTFELRDSRNRLIVVSVAFNAPRSVIDRFNRLRDGDSVRIEGRAVGTDRFELENFL
jgi:exosome complex RNA-binding protein Csl4